ncbi:unnamed protein product [Arctogadus glacialis]
MSDFPGGGADVPSLSNHLGKDNQVWERPWTLGEMRQASANWSLAADSGLFLFLQDFSQRMLSKTHDIEKQLDGLMRDTKATDSCLHSVFNDFLMLSNTQFIENRVYDEEVEEPIAKVESAVKHPEKEKTREQKEAELIPKMQEAVNYGLRVLDSAFEQLDIKAGNSDSEDEEAMDRVEAILEPKDLYVDRPLPYLIGSQAFMEQDDVGLGDLSSDEMSIDSDRDSVIESEDGKGEVQSDEEFEEAEGRGSINKKSSVLSYEEDEEEDEDSDIFGESDKEEEYEDENERKIASSTSFVDELAARIKGDPVSKGEEDRASLASSKKRAKSKKVAKAEKSPAAAVVRQESDDMFQPPRMEEEEFSPFGGGGGLFSGGRGLFDDDDENGPPVETPVSHTTPGNQTQIPQARGLFSDDEDTQVFPTPSKNQSKPGSAKQPKAPVSLFDNEEEEDLFASVAKSKPKPSQAKATTPQPQKTLSLFSDDEDQWLGSQPGTGRTETKTGGMKASVSAPSNLPSARAPPNGSLFEDEDEDLFATAKTSSPLKSQRVALLFEDDEDQGFLFGSKPAVGSSAKASATKAPVVAPKAPAPSLFDQEPRKEVPASGSVVEKAKPPEDTCDGEVPDRQPPSSSTSSTISSSLPASDREPRKQKPAGAVSLFGGIDIMASRRREGAEGDVLTEDRLPPPDVGEEDEEEEEEETTEKTKANPVSIFDGDDNDDDDEEEDSDWNVSGAVVRPPITTNAKQPAREQQRTKSTGVFQDEELLFSDTQQKDNDPDVDLFATSGKTVSAKPSSVKTDVPSLFADDDDDLFSSAKPKPPHPKVAKKPSKPKQEPTPSWKGISAASTPDSERTAASPVKAKDPLSRIGKLQANLVINPKAMLPGAAPRIPGAVGALPGTPPGSSSGVSSSSLSPSPVTTPLGSTHSGMEQGVSFESPLQVAPLPSTNKSRVKGSGQRRPQSRAARQQSVQRSVSDQEDSAVEPNPRLNPTTSALGFPTTGPKPNLRAPRPMLPKPSGTSAFPTPSPSQLSFTESLTRPSVLSLPVSTHPGETDSSEVSGDAQPMLSSSDEDLFGSVAVSKSSAPPAPSITKKAPDPSPAGGPAPVSIFDQQATSDLFQKVKPRAKKAQAPSFMEDADEDGDDDEDIFGMSTGSTPSSTSDSRTPSSPAKLDRFQDNETTLPKAGHKKHKEKTMEASLFDDNVDIFADLTMSSGPKDKPKKKMDTKSIFDDDMDDIFSSNKVKPVKKAPPKSKKSKPTQDNSVPAESANIFDDPLNAFGGN